MLRILSLLILLGVTTVHAAEISKAEEDEFMKGFMAKRAAMLTVIKDLTEMSEEKRGQTLGSLFKSMHKVLSEAKSHLEASSTRLLEPKTKEYLALLLENTCFFSDILLRFPDYTAGALAGNVEINSLYRWSLNFINAGTFPPSLLNAPTKKLLHLAAQELGVGEKDPDYVNPYKKPKTPLKRFEDPPIVPKKQKKKMKRGPKLNVEL